MPLRCTKCGTVAQTQQDRMCECDADYFKPCETIHFLHPKGPGPQYTKGKRVTKVPGEPPTKDSVALNVCCKNSKPTEQRTFLAPLVSCKECIQFLNTLRQTKEES